MKILINNKNINFNHDDFPMLISGIEKSGSSFFSVCLMEKLFNAGEKIIFFSAFPQAKKQFRDEVGDNINDNALILESGEEVDLLDAVNNISDLEERILLVKNIEHYETDLFDRFKDKKLIIFSGDIDKCEFNNELIIKEFKTKIFFSYPEKITIDNKIDLPKYTGLIINDKYTGLISISI